MKFNKTYFVWFLILFLIEVCIALFLKDGFIRHTFGDVLVVILIYCFIKSFINSNLIKTVLFVLLFAFSMEFLQLTPLLKWLDLENHTIANIILGNTFHYTDLMAYFFGGIIIVVLEKNHQKFTSKN